MSSTTVTATSWSNGQKIAFRIAFIFFIAISIPNSAEWYDTVIHIDWTRLNYRDLYDIARFGSGINVFGNSLFGSTLLGWANWVITLIAAIVVGLIWTFIVRARKTERKEYSTLYYWLRVVVRYRAGIGIIGFGFTKLLPVQMPYPGLGLLNTNFGDMTTQKIFWLSVGIVPWYQVFAGVVECLAGTLLFFRRTTTIGAILLIGALGDITYVNLAYDGGVHVYASYFVLLSAFLLVDDVPKLYNLLIRERYTVPTPFYPPLPRWLKVTRAGLKSLTIFLFLGVLFYLQLINFLYDPYKQPAVAGVRTLRGNYAVTEFRVNNKIVPYSPLDSVGWHEVEFENWSSLSFTQNRPTPLDLSNGGGDPQQDVNRTFELTGIAGGRRVFHYYADTVDKVLYLEDKYKAIPDRRNRAAGVGGDGYQAEAGGKGGGRHKGRKQGGDDEVAKAAISGGDTAQGPASTFSSGVERTARGGKGKNWIPAAALAHIGNEVDQIDPRAKSTRRVREYAAAKFEKRNRMVLQYDAIDNGNRVILSGINEKHDSIYIVLDRIDRNFALTESSLQAGKY
jgi:hypothetical protein